MAQEEVSEGLVNLLKPPVLALDAKVNSVRESQVQLRLTIDSVAEELDKISQSLRDPNTLDPYIKKLLRSRQQIHVIGNVLQNTHSRLSKLQQSIHQEQTYKANLPEVVAPKESPEMVVPK